MSHTLQVKMIFVVQYLADSFLFTFMTSTQSSICIKPYRNVQKEQIHYLSNKVL